MFGVATPSKPQYSSPVHWFQTANSLHNLSQSVFSLRPLLKSTKPFGLLMCPLWSGLEPKYVLCQPFALSLLLATTWNTWVLLNVMNLIMHPIYKFLVRTLISIYTYLSSQAIGLGPIGPYGRQSPGIHNVRVGHATRSAVATWSTCT